MDQPPRYDQKSVKICKKKNNKNNKKTENEQTSRTQKFTFFYYLKTLLFENCKIMNCTVLYCFEIIGIIEFWIGSVYAQILQQNLCENCMEEHCCTIIYSNSMLSCTIIDIGSQWSNGQIRIYSE